MYMLTKIYQVTHYILILTNCANTSILAMEMQPEVVF